MLPREPAPGGDEPTVWHARHLQFAPTPLAIEEEQSAERLVLSRCGNVVMGGQIAQKGSDLRFRHLSGMALSMKEDELSDLST